MKPYGLCDICKREPAEIWVGRTSAASCKNSKCVDEIHKRYFLHCKEVDEQIKFEKEMENY